jgi:hypothetical protein
MTGADKIVEALKCTRDELALKIHLGSKDLKDEWADLEKRWHAFETKAQLERSSEGVGAAIQILAGELKSAYERISKAL